MKIEKKSLTIGVLIGFFGTLFLFYFLGNVDTKFEIKTGHDKVISDFAKSIDVKLEKIVKNDSNLNIEIRINNYNNIN